MSTNLSTIAGVRIPSTAQAATELVRDAETELLYHHSRRVFLFDALTSDRRGVNYDAELLYIGAMFHDIGSWISQVPRNVSKSMERMPPETFFNLTDSPSGTSMTYGIRLALHTTPGIPKHKRATVALVTAGVEMDVLGIGFEEFTSKQRNDVCACHPRGLRFKQGILSSFCMGTIRKPNTTFGNIKADVLSKTDPTYKRTDFTEAVLSSKWTT